MAGCCRGWKGRSIHFVKILTSIRPSCQNPRKKWRRQLQLNASGLSMPMCKGPVLRNILRGRESIVHDKGPTSTRGTLKISSPGRGRWRCVVTYRTAVRERHKISSPTASQTRVLLKAQWRPPCQHRGQRGGWVGLK
jgi:hypothetical protein